MSIQPYWSDSSLTLYCGDMRDVLPELGQFDACVTDPPYGETSLAWDRWPAGWPAVVAERTSSMWCFGSMRMFLDRAGEFASWRLSQDVVWRKHNGSSLAADRFRRVHEHVTHWYWGEWSALHHETPRRSHFGPGKGSVHRQGQPPHLGSVGEHTWVLDPFAGSCSTGLTARQLGRRAVLVEADEAMCEKAVTLRLAVPDLFGGGDAA